MTLSKQQRLDTPISSAAGSADKAAPIDTWLASFCMSLDTARCGVVLEASADSGTLQSAAIWPAGVSDIAYLHPVCAAAIKQTTPVQLLLPRADAEGASHAVVVANSIKVEDRIAYVVVVDLGRPSSGVAEGVLQRLVDASGWLVAARERAGQQSQHQVIERLTLLTDTIALAGEDKHFRQAAMNIVNELARRFECSRASLGVEKANFIDVVAVSNKASFDIRTEEIRLIADAMDEALDQAYPIIHPAADPDALPVPAHAALAQHSRATSICSIPLRAQGRAMAALTLERHQGEPFAADSHELMAAFGDVLGTLVSLKIAADRGVWRRLVDAARDTASALFGPRHPALKFAFAASLLLVTALSLIHGDYRVAAKTVVEGAVQRAIVVPFDGFVAESGVRAGDVVKAAQLLCRLDDKDLQLEKAKWEAQVAQLLPKYREGLAMHDAGLRNVLGA